VEERYEKAAFEAELGRAAENFEVGSRLLFENDAVRIWAIELAPGERLPFHRHRTSYFYRSHADGRVQVRFRDGTLAVYDERPDDVHFHEIAPDDLVVHDLENVGDTPLAYTTVELLS
jgi:mannose-6-phosphate isomerase-like protein (cupin superfamily)